MNVRRVRPAVLAALITVGVLAAGGCGLTDAVREAVPPTSAAPLAPRDALLKSVPDGSTGSFHFTVEGTEVPASGEMHASEQSFRVALRYREPDAGFTLRSEYLVVRNQTWIKLRFTGDEGVTGLPRLPKKWLLIDPAKIKNPDDVPLGYADETDPGDTGAVLRAVVDAQRTTAGRYAGTADLTQQGKAEIVEPQHLAALGERAKTLSFEAATDAEGRLTTLAVRIPAAGKHRATVYEVTYDGYGTARTPAAPADDQQQKATGEVYELLNS
jgi:hypothetical protein